MGRMIFLVLFLSNSQSQDRNSDDSVPTRNNLENKQCRTLETSQAKSNDENIHTFLESDAQKNADTIKEGNPSVVQTSAKTQGGNSHSTEKADTIKEENSSVVQTRAEPKQETQPWYSLKRYGWLVMGFMFFLGVGTGLCLSFCLSKKSANPKPNYLLTK